MSPSTKIIRLKSLTITQYATYRRALNVIELMRRYKHLSLTTASREIGISPSTVRKFAGAALEVSHGHYRPTRADRLQRMMQLFDEQGPISIVIRSSRAASLIARYHNAVRSFICSEDDLPLMKFEGRFVVVRGKRHYFMTDRSKLRKLANDGELS